MKKIITMSLILVITLFVLSGCGKQDYEVLIKPDINKYSLTMSSVPGLPLSAEFIKGKNNEKIIYHWTTEEGSFRDWKSSSGVVSILGKDIKNTGEKIYWTPNEKIDYSSFKVYLKIEDSDSGDILAETSIEIERENEEVLTFIVKE